MQTLVKTTCCPLSYNDFAYVEVKAPVVQIKPPLSLRLRKRHPKRRLKRQNKALVLIICCFHQSVKSMVYPHIKNCGKIERVPMLWILGLKCRGPAFIEGAQGAKIPAFTVTPLLRSKLGYFKNA